LVDVNPCHLVPFGKAGGLPNLGTLDIRTKYYVPASKKKIAKFLEYIVTREHRSLEVLNFSVG